MYFRISTKPAPQYHVETLRHNASTNIADVKMHRIEVRKVQNVKCMS
jgi:hypothetical protein